MSTQYPTKFGRNIQNTYDAIRNREEFNANSPRDNLVGEYPNSYGRFYLGWLSEMWQDDFTETYDDIDYVVYSYATPIAWHMKSGEWVYPPVSYSPTTTGHQSVVRTALGINYDGTSESHEVRTHTRATERRAKEVFA